ncbi:MAG: RNA polymerase Rpb4 family protein [Nitrososphaerota archaeon]|nr:RNA polymerase Rpb4 family protein [Candidatus Calditenuaceae archaeon]MDW8074066.1 RNA polymerase Rpb4 family protein [Nitrososphaerota archaeon]
MPRKIISSTPLTISEVAELLSAKKEELTPLQLRVYNYVTTFTKLPAEKARMLVKELQEKFGLESEEACQIANICPRDVNEIRAILSGYRRLVSSILFSDQKLSEIVQTIESYLREEADANQVHE